MDTINNILQQVSGGWNRAWTNPNPQMSDEDIMRLYQGRVNQYATPEALRDAELGVQVAANDPQRPMTIILNNLRDEALRNRGLQDNQAFSDIPETSATGAILRQLVNQPVTGEYSGA